MTDRNYEAYANSVVESISNGVNTGLLKPEYFAEQVVERSHRTLQQLMFKCFYACIVSWAKHSKVGYCDARNEATTSICRKIVEHVGEDPALPFI